jgi:hypothetical protein
VERSGDRGRLGMKGKKRGVVSMKSVTNPVRLIVLRLSTLCNLSHSLSVIALSQSVSHCPTSPFSATSAGMFFNSATYQLPELKKSVSHSSSMSMPLQKYNTKLRLPIDKPFV